MYDTCIYIYIYIFMYLILSAWQCLLVVIHRFFLAQGQSPLRHWLGSVYSKHCITFGREKWLLEFWPFGNYSCSNVLKLWHLWCQVASVPNTNIIVWMHSCCDCKVGKNKLTRLKWQKKSSNRNGWTGESSPLMQMDSPKNVRHPIFEPANLAGTWNSAESRPQSLGLSNARGLAGNQVTLGIHAALSFEVEADSTDLWTLAT